jgi:general secretion pathway protein A
MYESFFDLRERPFDLTPNPRFLIQTASHREALSNLGYGISSRKGITLLVGEAGTGKTTVIRTALARQLSRVHCVHLHNPALTRPEFIEMLGTRFELSPRACLSKAALLVELESLLRAREENGEPTVLIVDEAQSLPLDLLEEIRLLANIESNEGKAMSVVIAGQPELAERLNSHELRQLKQRVALRCQLRPLTVAESAGYIAGRIQVAGGIGPQVFTREAVELIHQHSGGIPRLISVLADNALLTAFAAGERPVSGRTVRDVCRDFDLDEPAATTASRGDSSSSNVAVAPAPAAAAPVATPHESTRISMADDNQSGGSLALITVAATAAAPAQDAIAAEPKPANALLDAAQGEAQPDPEEPSAAAAEHESKMFHRPAVQAEQAPAAESKPRRFAFLFR